LRCHVKHHSAWTTLKDNGYRRENGIENTTRLGNRSCFQCVVKYCCKQIVLAHFFSVWCLWFNIKRGWQISAAHSLPPRCLRGKTQTSTRGSAVDKYGVMRRFERHDVHSATNEVVMERSSLPPIGPVIGWLIALHASGNLLTCAAYLVQR
jgi:hypothetical protein